MPNFKIGNMWDAWDKADLFLITTNAIIKADGELVMGRGMALEARNRDLQIAIYFGRALADFYSLDHTDYGLIVPDMWPYRKEGMFQTKNHYGVKASIEIIQMSTNMLIAWCKTHADRQVHLNYPGIGHGGLSKKIVEPIITELPNTVTIWSKE